MRVWMCQIQVAAIPRRRTAPLRPTSSSSEATLGPKNRNCAELCDDGPFGWGVVSCAVPAKSDAYDKKPASRAGFALKYVLRTDALFATA